jgi:hypothetical protein
MLSKKLPLMAKSRLPVRPALAFLLLAPYLSAGADLSPQQVLERIRAGVRQQLTTVSNYTCVESVDRTYLLETLTNRYGCEDPERRPAHLYMHDRLRLDVAVSEGREIFSWHGGKSFSSKGVDDVVQSGPIASGSFVGYLRNIFFEPGVVIRFMGHISKENEDYYKFYYVVPRRSSLYQVGGKGKRWIVAFHGEFTGSGTDYQLRTLQVIADDVPPASDICNAGSEIEYQLLTISGKPSLIPKNYVLEMDNPNHVHTVSRSDYSQCREFRGESTLSFDIPNDAAKQETPVIHDGQLPVGTTLRVRLRTPLDDRLSFTGDPVEGSLVNSVKVKGSDIVIPKDAILSGVITKLTFYNQPYKYYLVSIRFYRLTFGPNSFVFDAAPIPSAADTRALANIYGGHIPPYLGEELKEGVFVRDSGHIHIDQHFVADWRTKSPGADGPE